MYIFFDTEFTGLQKDTDLISIGLITWGGSTFYAEFTDYRKELCDDWIKENVINKLVLSGPNPRMKPNGINYHIGTKAEIASALREWLGQFLESVTLVSDVCHYDMTLFLDLFGGAFNAPNNVSPWCYDIMTDIIKYLNVSSTGFRNPVNKLDIRNNGIEKAAFDMDREELVKTLITKIGLPEEVKMDESISMKHSALHDARVIRLLFSLLNIYFNQNVNF